MKKKYYILLLYYSKIEKLNIGDENFIVSKVIFKTYMLVKIGV